jgi:hypothetical protein
MPESDHRFLLVLPYVAAQEKQRVDVDLNQGMAVF